jgi:hypothetical protein
LLSGTFTVSSINPVNLKKNLNLLKHYLNEERTYNLTELFSVVLGWRCKRYGHRTGDKECPFFIKGNQKLEQFRVVSKTPLRHCLQLAQMANVSWGVCSELLSNCFPQKPPSQALRCQYTCMHCVTDNKQLMGVEVWLL